MLVDAEGMAVSYDGFLFRGYFTHSAPSQSSRDNANASRSPPIRETALRCIWPSHLQHNRLLGSSVDVLVPLVMTQPQHQQRAVD